MLEHNIPVLDFVCFYAVTGAMLHDKLCQPDQP